VQNTEILQVAIVHYHLRPGGVTRVIENAVAAMADRPIEVIILTGEAYPGSYLKPLSEHPHLRGIFTVPNLNYTLPNEKPDAGALAYSLRKTARDAFGKEPDIWHIHNHSLGKNAAMPGCAQRLAWENAAVLYQLHDFAEDGRPSNWTRIQQSLANPRYLYPVAPHIHYAALNVRDLDILRQSGISDENSHLLPNPIPAPKGEPDLSQLPEENELRQSLGSPKRLFTYPTRAIRRKNVGEVLYWAAAAAEGDLFATTLEPANPEWREIYNDWTTFAKEHRLPLRFGIGEGQPGGKPPAFDAIVRGSDTLLTTSVAEGFGLAFLEPWVLGRPLVGRDLPDITRDVKRKAVNLSHLYARLEVPLEAVGADRLRQRLSQSLEAYFNAYERPLPNDAVERAFTAFTNGGDTVDFGRLDEPLQQAALEWLLAHRDHFAAPLEVPADARLIQGNAEVIREDFSVEKYGERLLDLYGQIHESPRGQLDALAPDALLEKFLDPARFNLLRA